MKKKGFTLIELIITLSIIVLFTTIISSSIKAFKNREININANKHAYDIKTLLSYGKSYCRKYNANGSLFIDIKEQVLKFEVSEKGKAVKKSVNFTKDFSIYSNYNQQIIPINREGYIKEAGTISLNYKGKTVKKITVGVGNDIIGVTEGDLIE